MLECLMSETVRHMTEPPLKVASLLRQGKPPFPEDRKSEQFQAVQSFFPTSTGWHLHDGGQHMSVEAHQQAIFNTSSIVQDRSSPSSSISFFLTFSALFLGPFVSFSITVDLFLTQS